MRIIDVAQLLAALAVFIGLGLVVYELRQTQTLARAGVMSGYWDQVLENERARLGENPAKVLAKRCEPLAEVTAEEREILSAAFGIRIAMVERTRLIEEILQTGVPWEELAYEIFRLELATPIGMHDFKTGKPFDHQTGEEGIVNGWPLEYQPIVERIMSEGIPKCGEYWDGLVDDLT